MGVCPEPPGSVWQRPAGGCDVRGVSVRAASGGATRQGVESPLDAQAGNPKGSQDGLLQAQGHETHQSGLLQAVHSGKDFMIEFLVMF